MIAFLLGTTTLEFRLKLSINSMASIVKLMHEWES